MPEHGGQLRRAVLRYGRPLEEWLDLSTGVNPMSWPIAAMPESAWARLPEENDGLEEAAREFYGAPAVLAIPGSQAAIMSLPHLRAASRVGLLSPAYFEHALRWQQAGHEIVLLSPEECDKAVRTIDVMVLVNPNNPTGHRFARAELLRWHASLAGRGGWLIVDEAFADASPQESLAPISDREGLIVLRSLGKFFGLAGARVGFALAAPTLLSTLAKRLGPWTVSGPSRLIATRALTDRPWQQATRAQLQAAGARLAGLLTCCGQPPSGGCELFQWRLSRHASAIHESLARAGILTRLFESPASLRFGLPGAQPNWERLERALRALPREMLA